MSISILQRFFLCGNLFFLSKLFFVLAKIYLFSCYLARNLALGLRYDCVFFFLLSTERGKVYC